MTPLPAEVSATGMPVASANAASARSAAEYRTPPPAISSGRRAPASTPAAASTSRSAGGRRTTGQTRGSKNRRGKSALSPSTSWCSATVTAPASAGSSSTRIASGSASSSCSGRATRSKCRLSGRNASLTDTSPAPACSSCWSTTPDRRDANVSAGSSSTGRRLTVAVAAPVSMFVAPGPIEAVQASVCSRRAAFA